MNVIAGEGRESLVVFVRSAAVAAILVLVSAVVVACGQEENANRRGQLVLFRIAGNPPRLDLVIVNSDGTDARPLIGDSVDGNVRPALFAHPSWSPDGDLIAFDSGFDERGFERDVYVLKADGTALRRLTSDRASFHPVWSPDGRSILFARWFGRPFARGSNLWVMDADGSNPHAITRERRGVFDRPGSFLPDGTTVAFSRLTDPYSAARAGEILTMNVDGSNLHVLAERSSDPAYSPDGRTIAFVSERDENGELCYGDRCFYGGELYVMAADGEGQKRLTETNALNEAAPAWSPDGQVIVYQRGEAFDNAEGMGVFAVNRDGTCATAILLDPELDTWYSAPEWRPGESAPGAISC